MGVYGHSSPPEKDKPSYEEWSRDKYDRYAENFQRELNPVGTIIDIFWRGKWFFIPAVLVVLLYEPIHWTILNVWCWLYGLFY